MPHLEPIQPVGLLGLSRPTGRYTDKPGSREETSQCKARLVGSGVGKGALWQGEGEGWDGREVEICKGALGYGI